MAAGARRPAAGGAAAARAVACGECHRRGPGGDRSRTPADAFGHAGALGGSVGATLIISEVLHLLAAGAWLGSLLPLFITIGTLPHDAAATACRSFTPVGLSAVVVLGGTATVQVNGLMGGVPGLFGTGYGQVALVKLGLFGVLLSLAALNRLALTDRLAGAAPTPRGATCVSLSLPKRCWARWW